MIALPTHGRVYLACGSTDMRRGFDGLAVMVQEVLMQRLYNVEEDVRGQPPDTRRATRQAQAKPQLDALKARMEAIRAKLSTKSTLAVAITYTLKRWPALTRYCEDGCLEIDNLIAERALRGVAIGRRNWLFTGSKAGGE